MSDAQDIADTTAYKRHGDKFLYAETIAALRAENARLKEALNDAVGWMIANPAERDTEEHARIETLERCGKAQRAALAQPQKAQP